MFINTRPFLRANRVRARVSAIRVSVWKCHDEAAAATKSLDWEVGPRVIGHRDVGYDALSRACVFSGVLIIYCTAFPPILMGKFTENESDYGELWGIITRNLESHMNSASADFCFR